jgi:transitional endoplasmic reticulum ATPase
MADIRLRVREGRIEDVDRGIARVHPAHFAGLVGVDGLVIRISGRGTAVARAVAGDEQGVIRMDGYLRADADAAIGSMVTVAPEPARPATAVVLTRFGPAAGAGDVDVPSGSDVARLLAGRPVMVGSQLAVRRFGRGVRLLVTGAAPDGTVVITPATAVTVVRADVDIPPRPASVYEDIGGLRRELQRVREMVELPLRYPGLFLKLGIDPPKGLLLCGPPGTGKTLIARALANEVKAHFIHVNGPEIMHKYYGESEARLRAIFEEAEREAPSIIFLDELDAIAPKRTVVAGEVEKRVVGQLLALMDGLVARGQVIVIGATNMPDLLDPALRRPGRFDRELVTRVPDEDERLEILRIHTRDMPLAPDVDLRRLAEVSGGFVGADLEILCKEAAMAALRRMLPALELDGGEVTAQLMVAAADFDEALREVEPAATRELRAERPGVTFGDVAGLEATKARLTATLIEPMRRSLLQRQTLAFPQTYLFCGPPGVGKNLLARALAGQLGMSVIELEPSLVLSRWPGETERAVAEIFRVSHHAAPCLLLLEGLDAIAPARSSEGAAGVSVRLVTKLLREMREAKRTWGLVIVATTDRPELVDPAVSQAFEIVVPFALPAEAERRAIFALKLGARPGLDYDALAAGSEGLSGEEIEAVCRHASALALGGAVEMAHLEQALRGAVARPRAASRGDETGGDP